MSYSNEEILEFQNKDKRIMFQSVFSSLTNYYGLLTEKKSSEELVKTTSEIVQDILDKYPMKEIPQHIKNIINKEPF